MPNMWFGVFGVLLTFTVINCEPIVQIAKVSKSHPLVQYITGKWSGGNVPDVAPIVGGETAQENGFPWQVLTIYWPNDNNTENFWLCGGTILDKRTIITAAHCTEIDPEQKAGIFLGVAGWFDLTTDPLIAPAQVFEVEDVRMHRRYKRTTKTIYHDIALLIVHDDLDFSTPEVQPVPYLADRKMDYLATRGRNDKCVTVGFGVNQSDSDSESPVVTPTGNVQETDLYPDSLQVLEGTNLVNYRTCWQALRGSGLAVLPTNICALDKGQGFCFGDSGGFTGCEITNRNSVFYQVAIPSWITSRDCSVGIQVFTRVAKYRRWIEYWRYK